MTALSPGSLDGGLGGSLAPLVPTVGPQAAVLGWQPIETAPRDGTRIIATGGGLLEEIEIVSYSPKVGCWNTPQETLDDRDDESGGYNRPTHWMRLPPAPSDTTAGGWK